MDITQNPNLCRYCCALLSGNFESEHKTRNKYPRCHVHRGQIETVESVYHTASLGCLLCHHLIDSMETAPRELLPRIEALPRTNRYGLPEHYSIKYSRWIYASDHPHDNKITMRFYMITNINQLPLDIPAVMATAFSGAVTLFPHSGKGSCTKGNKVLSANFYPFLQAVKHLTNTGQVGINTGSEPSFELVSTWLDQCTQAHTACNVGGVGETVATLPTRIVHLPESANPRLLLVDHTTPKLPYATLSHCWGSEMPLRLTTENMTELEVEIPLAKLSKTFVDAFEIARRIGLRYIWIDSICILQDSLSDWNTEGALMGQVYTNASCNISAAFASNGSYGCFIDRNPDLVKPLKISVNWGPRTGIYHPLIYMCRERKVVEAPVNLRAWVCQERYLARRNIYFTDTQLFWECSELCANETYPFGLPKAFEIPGNSVDPDRDGASRREREGLVPAPELHAFDLWGDIITQYTMGRLTYQTDRLAALSGLASSFQQHTRSRYLAGLWERHLAPQLLWRPLDDYSGGAKPLPVQSYIAPSWSWASVNRQTWNSGFHRYSDGHDVVVQFLDAQVTLADENNPFGPVTGGHLQVKCPLGKTTDRSKMPEIVNTSFDNADEEDDNITDSAEMNEECMHLWYMPVQAFTKEDIEQKLKYGKQTCVSGIILQSTTSQDELQDDFKRVGQFYIEGRPDQFQLACRQYAEEQGLSYGDGDEPDVWGPRHVITIV